MDQVARGGLLHATVQYTTGSGVFTNPATPTYTVYRPDDTIETSGVPTFDYVGHYHADVTISAGATLGTGWRIVFTGTIAGDSVTSTCPFEVVVAGASTCTLAPVIVVGPCMAWCALEDVCQPAYADIDPIVLDRMIGVASSLLYEASNRQFPGLCTRSILPCAQFSRDEGYVRWLQDRPYWGESTWAYNSRSWTGFCGCNRSVQCGCLRLHAIKLSSTFPVRQVLEVYVPDEGILTSDQYHIEDRRWLVRDYNADGTNNGWPCCTDPTDPFSVTFLAGTPPPAPGVFAASTLAGELGLLCSPGSGGKCRLPVKTTSVTRQGISLQLQQQISGAIFQTGVWEVDTFLSVYKGHARAGVLVPSSGSKQMRVRG